MRSDEEDEEEKEEELETEEENERIYERAKRRAVQLGRAVSWRRGCSVSSAPNDSKATPSDDK